MSRFLSRDHARKLAMNAALCVLVRDPGPQVSQQMEVQGNSFCRYNPSYSSSVSTFPLPFKTCFTKDFFFLTE